MEKIINKFVKSEDDEADIFTKNTRSTNTIFQNQQKKFVWDNGEVNKEGSQELTQKDIQQEGC